MPIKLPPPTGKSKPVSGLTTGSAVKSALTAHASSQYQSLWHGTQTPTRIVIHDTEGDTAQSAINAWSGSKYGAQIIIGPDGTITRVVPDNQVAWSTGGNNHGTLAIEIVGHASDSKDAWLQKSAQLQAVSEVLGYWSQTYNIPLVSSTVHGVSTHAMNSALYSASQGHTDPGPNFPFQQVIQAAGGKATAFTTAQPKGYAWESALADQLGVPFNAQVKKFFDSWNAVDRTKAGEATNNPFNITNPGTPGDPKWAAVNKATGKLAGNPAGVLVFATGPDGIAATAEFIKNQVPFVITHLKNADFQGAAAAIGASGWAGRGAAGTTYGNNLYSVFTSPGQPTLGPNAPNLLSPTGKGQVSVDQSTATNVAKINSPAYQTSAAELAAIGKQARASAEATAHIGAGTEWVVPNKSGGFTLDTGPTAPAGVLVLPDGTQATQNDLKAFQSEWSQGGKASIFEAYTGKQSTLADQLKYASMSEWQLRTELSQQGSFTSSPIYKQQAPGLVANVKTALGKKPPPGFVRQAIAQNWDSATVTAKLKELPDYTNGPEFKASFSSALAVYKSIYGDTATPDERVHKILTAAVQSKETSDELKQQLMGLPEFKGSPTVAGWTAANVAIYQSLYGQAPPSAKVSALLKTWATQELTGDQVKQKLQALPGGQLTSSSVNAQAGAQAVAESIYGTGGLPADAQAVVKEAVAKGWDQNVVQQKLRALPSYKQSAEKLNAAGTATAAAQSIFGQAALPPDAAAVVAQAAKAGWNQDVVLQKLRALPSYRKSEEFLGNVAGANTQYQTTTGAATESTQAEAWLRQAVLKGWSSDQIAQKLRADPAYKYSPEYQSKAVNFLSAMGLFTGQRPVAGIQDPGIIKQNTAGTKVGAIDNLQIGMGGQ